MHVPRHAVGGGTTQVEAPDSVTQALDGAGSTPVEDSSKRHGTLRFTAAAVGSRVEALRAPAQRQSRTGRLLLPASIPSDGTGAAVHGRGDRTRIDRSQSFVQASWHVAVRAEAVGSRRSRLLSNRHVTSPTSGGCWRCRCGSWGRRPGAGWIQGLGRHRQEAQVLPQALRQASAHAVQEPVQQARRQAARKARRRGPRERCRARACGLTLVMNHGAGARIPTREG